MAWLRFIAISALLLTGCVSNQPAPVIERAPAVSEPPPAEKTTASKDWRPETYTVKKGDTLFSIGLEHGYDYKEIAQINNIAPPYIIHIGQKLQLRQKPGAPAPAAKPAAPKPVAPAENEDVVITPLKMDNVAPAPIEPQPTAPSAPAPAPKQDALTLNAPKAFRLPYSDAALNAPVAEETKPASSTVAPPAATTGDTAAPAAATGTESGSPTATPPAPGGEDGTIDWAWPAKGKVIAGFNDTGSAKGIDIAGETGQPVLAAAPGKVIYSGADLRGYGKLVIIKHNKTFLSVYAHNSQILVKEGQQVSKGQKIAEMGNSDTDRVKLHFEIRQQGKSVDPAKFLPGAAG